MKGGISTPLIVHWPEKDKKQVVLFVQNLLTLSTSWQLAWMLLKPVILKLIETNPFKAYGRRKPGSGFLIISPLQREAIYWEHEGNRAVRMGKWKLVSKVSKRNSFIWDKKDELDVEQWGIV